MGSKVYILMGLVDDLEDTHHLVVLVRQDVAVPDIAAQFVEVGLDACGLLWKSCNHILVCIKRNSFASQDFEVDHSEQMGIQESSFSRPMGSPSDMFLDPIGN
jgi:hypothetical protein